MNDSKVGLVLREVVRTDRIGPGHHIPGEKRLFSDVGYTDPPQMRNRPRIEYPPAPLLATLLRFRCPHCGRGAVITGILSMHERCAVCGFDFKRGNPAYFSGAIFINYLLGAGAAIALFLVVLAATWPRVPWNVLAYAAPAGAIVIILLLYPVSKMILLAIDVRLRPITEDELMGGTRPTGDAVS